jgi:CRISPR-associated protein (TIGR03986 family)
MRYTPEVVIPDFVNPYTFVPLSSDAPERGAPYGHSGADGSLLSGSLRVNYTARTPLLVRGFGAEETPAVPTRPGATGEDEMIIPGSALHGATRSLHEAANGGCLRVFDADFVPIYRHPAKTAGLRLSIVESVTDGGTPQSLRVCEEGDPVRQRLSQDRLVTLHQKAAPVGLCSGDRLRVTFDTRGEVATTDLDANGDWVVFISDSKARQPNRPYHAAIRKLGGTSVSVSEDVWATFLKAVEGADDLRPARLRDEPESTRFTEVQHPHGEPRAVTVGLRSLTRRTVHKGQPLWVRLDADGGAVVELRMAMIWRGPGQISAGKRVGEHTACWDPEALCPSCRLFGSADTRGEAADKGLALQRSYRGHVRFGDAVAAPGTKTIKLKLPPLGAPKPGAGQFYLANSPDAVGNVDERALREWGSPADGAQPRTLRGRKFYWHTTVPNGTLPRRGQAGKQHADNSMTSDAVAYTIGARFAATVTFTDIDRGQLAALVVALTPSSRFGENAMFHLGGGRPLGYGSCAVSIDPEASWWTTAEDRYRGRPPTTMDADEQSALASELVVAQDVGKALTKVLCMGAVLADDVGYPGAAAGEDVTFAFWKQSSGQALKDKGRGNDRVRQGFPLLPLPDVLAENHYLPEVKKAEPTQVRKKPVTPGTRPRR